MRIKNYFQSCLFIYASYANKYNNNTVSTDE